MRSLYGMWKPQILGEAPVHQHHPTVLLLQSPDAVKGAASPQHAALGVWTAAGRCAVA